MNLRVKLKVGDLVTWTMDDDVGLITSVNLDPECEGVEDEPYWIQWSKEPTASGWHAPHKCLVLLSSV